MILKLTGDIDEQALSNVIESYNNLPQDDILDIYLKSRGGEYGYMEAIIDLIEKNKEKTYLNAFYEIGSCAFELFYSVTCTRNIIGGCIGMYHQAYIPLDINERKRPRDSEDKTRLDYMKTYMHDVTTNLCNNIGMSILEINKIRTDTDVWFSNERLWEFLANQVKKRIITNKILKK
jgi:ATP-dependent protease ClpP protease subunit